MHAGLVCKYIGGRRDLEKQSVENIIAFSRPLREMYSYPEPQRVMKYVHKTSWGNIARVTAMTPQLNNSSTS